MEASRPLNCHSGHTGCCWLAAIHHETYLFRNNHDHSNCNHDLSFSNHRCTIASNGLGAVLQSRLHGQQRTLAGGSEILHLVSHKGKLYVAVGYWMDPRNLFYGGKDPSTGWAQIIRLDKPGGKWEVDLEMGPQYLRPEILKSITFTTDGNWNLLKEPVQLLITSTYDGDGSRGISFFVRNDETGQWEKSKIISGDTGKRGEENSVRATRVYRDKVTGIDRIFISIGVLGIYSGIYDPAAPGKIRWDNKSESGPLQTLPLAIIEANGSLLFSSGSKIYKRNDGPSPTYSVVYDADQSGIGAVYSPDGGIRGLSPIPNPKGQGESLLFCWVPGTTSSRGNIYRLDPDGKGGYTSTQEVCLGDLMSQYLNANPVNFVLAAYNNIMPVVDPSTKETVYIIGFESQISGNAYPTIMGSGNGGFYAGAMYAIRDKNGNYRLNEINGPITSDKPVLESTRTYVLSPFEEENNSVIYFGGIDCNQHAMHNDGLIFTTSLENALRKDAPGSKRIDGKSNSL